MPEVCCASSANGPLAAALGQHAAHGGPPQALPLQRCARLTSLLYTDWPPAYCKRTPLHGAACVVAAPVRVCVRAGRRGFLNLLL